MDAKRARNAGMRSDRLSKLGFLRRMTCGGTDGSGRMETDTRRNGLRREAESCPHGRRAWRSHAGSDAFERVFDESLRPASRRLSSETTAGLPVSPFAAPRAASARALFFACRGFPSEARKVGGSGEIALKRQRAGCRVRPRIVGTAGCGRTGPRLALPDRPEGLGTGTQEWTDDGSARGQVATAIRAGERGARR